MLTTSRTILILTALTVVAAITAPRLAQAQAVDAEAQSQLRFTRGRDLFTQRNFAGALIEFRAAFSLVRSPNIRLYVARTLRELGRFGEAFVEFQRAAAEAADRASIEPRFAGTRDTARLEGSEILNRIGQLTVHVPNPPEGIAVTVAGSPLSSAGWELPTPVDARGIEVTATAPGRLPYQHTITVHAGENAEVTVQLNVDPDAARAAAAAAVRASTPAPAPTRTLEGGGVRTAGIVVAGVGVVGGIGFAVFGLIARKQYSDLAMTCGPALCGPEHNAEIASGEQTLLLSNIAGAVGIGALTIGLIMVAAGGPHEVSHGSAGRAAAATGPRRASFARWNLWGLPTGNGGGSAGVIGVF